MTFHNSNLRTYAITTFLELYGKEGIYSHSFPKGMLPDMFNNVFDTEKCLKSLKVDSPYDEQSRCREVRSGNMMEKYYAEALGVVE